MTNAAFFPGKWNKFLYKHCYHEGTNPAYAARFFMKNGGNNRQHLYFYVLKTSKSLLVKKIITLLWGTFTLIQYLCLWLRGEIRGLQIGIRAVVLYSKIANFRIHQGTQVRDAPLLLSYMLTDRNHLVLIAIWRFGVGGYFLPFFWWQCLAILRIWECER